MNIDLIPFNKNEYISNLGKYSLVDREGRPCRILSWHRNKKPVNYNMPPEADTEYPIVYECIETGLVSCVDEDGKVYHIGNNFNDLYLKKI